MAHLPKEVCPRIENARLDHRKAFIATHFMWTDSMVIDFVNYYINMHDLGIKYTLENQTIIDNFKETKVNID